MIIHYAIKVITSLFLGAAAILGPAISDAIKRKWFAPVITPSFKQQPPFCQKTEYLPIDRSRIGKDDLWGVGDLWKYGGQPVYFIRFRVENTGKSRLNNCEAVIEQLYIYDSAGNPQKVDGFTDVSLVWADSDKAYVIDIGPNRPKYCNIGHIASKKYQEKIESSKFIDIGEVKNNPLRFFFELAYHPNSQPNCLIPGKYAIKVVLYSDNADKIELFFEIVWSGNWKDNISEMFRELAINKIHEIN